jgi:hypothetical protein
MVIEIEELVHWVVVTRLGGRASRADAIVKVYVGLELRRAPLLRSRTPNDVRESGVARAVPTRGVSLLQELTYVNDDNQRIFI